MVDNDDVRVGGNSILVLASIGAGAFLALLTILFFVSPASAGASDTPSQYSMQRVIAIASFLLASAALPLITNSHVGGRRPSVHLGTLFQNDRVFDALSIAAIIIGFGFTIALVWIDGAHIAPVGTAPMYAACVTAGVAVALNARVWMLFYSRAFYQLSRVSVFWSICMAVAIAGGFGLADIGLDFLDRGTSKAICCCIFVFVSIFACYYCKNDLSPTEDDGSDEYAPRLVDRVSSVLKVARPLYVGFSLALVVHLLLAFEGVAVCFTTFSCVLLVSAAAYAIATWILKSFIPIPTVDRLCCGLICVGFVVLPFTEGLGALVVLIILLLACLFFFVQTWCTVIQMMTYWRSISLPDRGIHSLASVIGFFVGYTLSAIIRDLMHVPVDAFIAMACIAVVALFVILCTFVPYDNPIWTEFGNLVNGIDSISMDEDLSPTRQMPDQESRCDRLARERGLTPREGEVLLLLAKGRNAAVIARELVISPYTAKTHIYRIMKKFDVQSQQDLIDIIDRG